ncbi:MULTISPECIES: peptidoglycan-binding domain-containing protein [Streptomyces]|uniref:Peptidoglycan-binding domain-containing protein n=1 Tax=Streptomyces edwardsiae TaxID=3075527 RepID=A0ABU2PQ78_9ACTN|nr:peptidoglycan-binding domain-containing protein [Streptomyces sp. DSM 41636]MDT0393961.1 peptidoglycan-binding domain-containing protein [Streptomyces sp. DSM 41636]
MEQPNGHPCPECGAPRNGDNTPSCACTLRASDALRDARTAEAAAAEDFDPLRIRPYVELEGEAPAPDETMTLRALPPEGVDATAVIPTPLAPGAGPPNTTDLSLFDGTRPLRTVPAAAAATAPPPSRRRRRGVLFAAAGAVVAVVGAAGWAGGMFSYETPSRDGAAPKDVRESVPDVSETPSASAAASSSAAPVSSSAPAETPSASASASASPSVSASTPSSSPSSAVTPSPSPSASAPAEAPPAEEEVDEGAGPVLRRGDQGAEVVELQLRLKEKWLYNEEIHGNFNRRVEEALRNFQWPRGLQSELGVYGPETRARLQSETREP